MGENISKVRNVLFYVGLAAAVISMLFSGFSKIFSFMSAVVAMVSLVIGVILMIVILVKDKSKSGNS